MQRLTHIVLLMAFLPAILMPTRVVVCLTNGIGHNCCSGSEIEPSTCSLATTAAPAPNGCCCSSNACQETAPDSCPESIDDPQDGDQGRGDQIVSSCKCCIAIENPRDEFEKTDYSVEFDLPPLGPGVAVEFTQAIDIHAKQVVEAPTADPPRILPLLI